MSFIKKIFKKFRSIYFKWHGAFIRFLTFNNTWQIFIFKSSCYKSKSFFNAFYGAFITATSFTIWTIVLQNHSANQFGVFKLFIPIFGSILSVIILGENFTIRLFIGLILVLTGSLVLMKGKNKKDSLE
ncbi:MAG: EamA family transporter [Anaerococcus obesiensis]